MVSESLSALISAVIKVQRTALGLDTEKRPFPYRSKSKSQGRLIENPSAVFMRTQSLISILLSARRQIH